MKEVKKTMFNGAVNTKSEIYLVVEAYPEEYTVLRALVGSAIPSIGM